MITAHYPRRVVRLWWVTVLTVVLGLAVAALAHRHQVPRYVAVAQMTVGYEGATSPGRELEAHNLSIYRAAALADLAVKPPVVLSAMAHAGVTGPPPRVAAGSYGLTSALVGIAVTDTDPVRAARIANGFAAVLPIELARLVGPLDRGMAVRMTAEAVPPTSPITPSGKRVLALGLLLGIVAGLAIVGVVELRDRSIRDSDQLDAATGLPLLGVVPHGRRSGPLPMRSDPSSPRSAAYRGLRTVLKALDADVVAVTSPLDGEGRSTLVANVAMALEATGTRVLVIEADLRRPALGSVYGVGAEVGLTHVLRGRSAVGDAIRSPGAGAPHVLLAGTMSRTDADLMVDSVFRDVVEEVRDDFDLVLIDAPHAEGDASAGIVCAAADATILVARIGRSTPRLLGATLASLRVSGARVVGVVANDSRGRSSADVRLPLGPRAGRWARRG